MGAVEQNILGLWAGRVALHFLQGHSLLTFSMWYCSCVVRIYSAASVWLICRDTRRDSGWAPDKPKSQNHGITDWLKLEGTSWGHLVQPPSSRRLPRIRWLLKISKENNTTASLGNLYLCSVTHRLKKNFLIIRETILCFNLCPLPLVLLLGTTGKSLGSLLFAASLQYLYTLMEFPLSLVFSRVVCPSSLSLSS